MALYSKKSDKNVRKHVDMNYFKVQSNERKKKTQTKDQMQLMQNLTETRIEEAEQFFIEKIQEMQTTMQRNLDSGVKNIQ